MVVSMKKICSLVLLMTALVSCKPTTPMKAYCFDQDYDHGVKVTRVFSESKFEVLLKNKQNTFEMVSFCVSGEEIKRSLSTVKAIILLKIFIMNVTYQLNITKQ